MDDVALLLPIGYSTLALVLVVLAVGLAVPPRGGVVPGEALPAEAREPVPAGPTGGSPYGGLLTLTVLVVLGATARLGGSVETTNPVSILVVGLGPFLLLVVPLVLSPLLGRAAAAGPPVLDARLAVLPAAATAVFLVLPASSAAPGLVASGLLSYAVVLAAVGVTLGLDGMRRADALGLLARWAALGPRLGAWAPPRGAAAVVAAVLGGVCAERFERTTFWQNTFPTRTELLAALVVLVLAALALAFALERATRAWPGTAAAVLVPLLAGAVAGTLVRRAIISAQLLRERVQPGQQSVSVDPLGIAGGQALALVLVGLGASVAAAVLARRVGRGSARLPGLGLLLLATGGIGVLVLQP